ncbi:MAG: tetratricopeptide repeat protein [Phycisphaeraceae bacterium]|nr:tetratricopeptide repeat protein [Phycisphaeraceae bacterium]
MKRHARLRSITLAALPLTALWLGGGMISAPALAEPPRNEPVNAAAPGLPGNADQLRAESARLLALGQYAEARPLLEALVQLEPRSVEAHLHLARAQLILGDIEAATAVYRTIVRLSPGHPEASAFLQRADLAATRFQTQLRTAEHLVTLGMHGEAQASLRRLFTPERSPEEQVAARVLLAQSLLLSRTPKPVLTLIQELDASRPTEAQQRQGRFLVALAMLLDDSQRNPAITRQARSLFDLGEQAEPIGEGPLWESLQQVMADLLELRSAEPAIETIMRTSQRLTVAQHPVEDELFKLRVSRLQALLDEAQTRGDWQEMISLCVRATDPAANENADVRPWDLTTPLIPLDEALRDGVATGFRVQINTALRRAAELEHTRTGHANEQRALRLAYRLVPVVSPTSVDVDEALALLESISAGINSRAAMAVRPDHPAHANAAWQLQAIAGLWSTGPTAAHTQRLERIILQRIEFRLAWDPTMPVATALEGMIRLPAEPDGQAELLPALGPGQADLIVKIAQRLQQRGGEELASLARAGSRHEAGQPVESHRAAATLLRLALARHPDHAAARALAAEIAGRYAQLDDSAAALWVFTAAMPADDAIQAIEARIAVHHMLLERDELRLRERGLALPEALNPNARAIAELAVEALAAVDQPESLARAAGWLGTLGGRYTQQRRLDLADAVIDVVDAALAEAPAASIKGQPLALRLRADFRQHMALARWGDHVQAAIRPEDVTLMDEDAGTIQFLERIIADHPRSPQAIESIAIVDRIAQRYAQRQAFEVARSIHGRMLEALADREDRDRWTLAIIALDMQEGHQQLTRAAEGNQVDPDQAALIVAPAHQRAIERIEAFVADRPDSPGFRHARGQLAGLALHYAELGRWVPVRDMLGRLNRLGGEPATPNALRLQHAITHLGPLDPARALVLLRGQVVITPESTRESSSTLELGARGRLDGRSGYDADEWERRPEDRAITLADEVEHLPGIGGRAGGGGPSADPRPSVPAPRAAGQAWRYDEADAELAQAREGQLAMIRRQEGERLRAFGTELDRQGNAARALEQVAQARLRPDSEMQRRTWIEQAEPALALLLEVARAEAATDQPLVAQARQQLLWLIGFFEDRSIHDHAATLLDRWLAGDATHPARVALGIRALENQLRWASRPAETASPNMAWLEERIALFTRFNERIEAWINNHADLTVHREYLRQARMMRIQSVAGQASVTEPVLPGRAIGLRLDAADRWLALARDRTDAAQVEAAYQQAWRIAESLKEARNREAAVTLFSRIVTEAPDHALANQARRRIAEVHTDELTSPLRAVEAWQEYFALSGQDVSSQIHRIGEQLASMQRYLEALHVYGVFVDSFPTDPRAPQALLAIGQTHQANESWIDAMKAYQRLMDEYPAVGHVIDARLAMAECHIHLSQWNKARAIYEDFVRTASQHPRVSMAYGRIETLKNLARFQTLLADPNVQRNRDDAQFQIARICQERLENPIKAIEEYGKVLRDFPTSAWADDSQLEIGIILLALGRVDEGRDALLAVTRYENSPLAGRALFLLAQSYEQQAVQLASIGQEPELDRIVMLNRDAYQMQRRRSEAAQVRQQEVVRELRDAGKFDQLALEETFGNVRFNGLDNTIALYSRIAEIETERRSALELANLQDRINEAYRKAVAVYLRAAADYPLAERTADSLLRAARIQETQLRDIDGAMRTYERIVRFFPASPAAEDAAWKVAHSHVSKGRFEEAVPAFRDFIRKYPASTKLAEAQFGLAEALEHLGRWVEAMDAYETFRQRFEDHPNARIAAEQINWIKAYRR